MLTRRRPPSLLSPRGETLSAHLSQIPFFEFFVKPRSIAVFFLSLFSHGSPVCPPFFLEK